MCNNHHNNKNRLLPPDGQRICNGRVGQLKTKTKKALKNSVPTTLSVKADIVIKFAHPSVAGVIRRVEWSRDFCNCHKNK